MILGIDEYLTDTERDSDNEFIEFKKFFKEYTKEQVQNIKNGFIEQRGRKKNFLQHIMKQMKYIY